MNYMKSTITANLIREIIRLHYEKNLSIRKVSESTGVSRNRISRLVHHLNDISIDIQDVKAIKDDIVFFQKLSLTNVSNKSIKPHPDLSWVHSEMKNPHVTLDLLWKEWREIEPNGINYSQFVKVYRNFVKKLPVTMRQRHVPGENLFLDFAGQRVPVYTDNSTEARYAHIFVAVLGYSSYTFACAVWSQTTRNWLSCHVKAFNYFSGTTKYLVPDNLKAAVIKHSKNEILLNSQYQQLAAHYETVILPARPRKPKDKAKVEAGVKLVQRWLLASLRHQKFFSLDELNHALIGILPRLNERPFKSFPKESRLSRFIEIEQRALVPLPLIPFEPADFRENVKIGSSYMIEHAGNFYSVSYKLVGQKVAVRVTENVIEVFHNNLRVCSHTRLEDFIGEYSINDQHRHPNHKIYSDSSPDKLLAWGEYVGQSVLKHLHYHLFERIDRESNGRKAAYALKREAQNYGEERLEEACAYALSINTYALRSLRSILKTQADKRGGKKTIKNDSSVEHENLRGASYFTHNKES